MSGLAGYIGERATAKDVEQMIEAIKHRGSGSPSLQAVPSGFAGFVGANSLGFSGDKAPFVIMDGTLIRDDRQNGASDADYLREEYMKHGKDAFSRMVGSFSCAIMDENECIIARDHVGARPLVYHELPQGDFLFASEAKALKQRADSVEELPPGHYYSTQKGLGQFKNCSVTLPEWESTEEAIKAVRELLIKSIEQAISSGNIKGVALSGGLDSSIILAVAREFDKDIAAFTATFAERHGEDLEYAKLLADQLGVDHHIYEITREDIKNVLPEAVWYLESFDEDCITGFIANYYTSRFASDHVNSVLVGEGADELFGGYFRELQDISDPEEKERIGRKLLEVSYNTALRRLDRGWMANSIEYFAPFLHPAVVSLANNIPMDLKVYQKEDASIEKWILREAFRDFLPQEIADRPKLRFSRGVGVDDQVDQAIPASIGEKELQQSPKSSGGIALQSPKELYFYKLFQEHFPQGYEGLTARWDPFK
ncbi:asparagine synthetase B family protein [Dethiobacter alkaliphilus]|uniref:Asparagine synthase n=1 Tax=Dethiobacter alkaliphilus AHT 1 TaxID=555088 RepID=C0GFP8_DETAL|nr:asparagine synthase-related protein [Dethiobacter alkaliphilus]EEG78008.1 asparagine synthase [Dethiobacter alkaliphilus AHT 1]